MDQRQHFARLAGGQHAANRFQPPAAVVQFLDNPPVGRQTQLEREAAGQLHEKTVERADPQTVQIAKQLAQQLAAGRAVELPADLLGQRAAGCRVECRVGQPLHHAGQNLARRLACERRSQNRFGPLAGPGQLQIAVRQLKCLAGSGRCPNHHVRPRRRVACRAARPIAPRRARFRPSTWPSAVGSRRLLLAVVVVGRRADQQQIFLADGGKLGKHPQSLRCSSAGGQNFSARMAASLPGPWHRRRPSSGVVPVGQMLGHLARILGQHDIAQPHRPLDADVPAPNGDRAAIADRSTRSRRPSFQMSLVGRSSPCRRSCNRRRSSRRSSRARRSDRSAHADKPALAGSRPLAAGQADPCSTVTAHSLMLDSPALGAPLRPANGQKPPAARASARLATARPPARLMPNCSASTSSSSRLKPASSAAGSRESASCGRRQTA